MVSLPAGTKVFDPQFVNCDATLVQHIDIPHRECGLFERTRPIRSVSSGADSRATLEMIMAVHESNRLGTRVPFPLANRGNPYATWLAQEQ